MLCDLARRGVHVRGLLWRSHPRRRTSRSRRTSQLTQEVNEAGGEVLLDERVRRGGSHHQKLFVVRRAEGPDDDVAFAGGIDLCHGRHDDHRHLGDPQAVEINDRYGERPPWHDVQLEVRGPAVGELADTFRERWEDPTPLDHRNPVRRVMRRSRASRDTPDPLPPPRAIPALRDPRRAGAPHLPGQASALPVRAEGERSIARAYLKAFPRARRLIYFEDQYFWSQDAARRARRALRAQPELHIVAVVPRYPDENGRSESGEPPYRPRARHGRSSSPRR